MQLDFSDPICKLSFTASLTLSLFSFTMFYIEYSILLHLTIMRLFQRSSSHKLLLVSTFLTTGGALLVLQAALSVGKNPDVAPQKSPTQTSLQTRVSPQIVSIETVENQAAENVAPTVFDAENVSDNELDMAQLTAYAPRGSSTRGGRMIHVGLSTGGAPIVLLPTRQLIITDAVQKGRRLVVRADETVTFTLGANETLQARGQTFSGPIRVVTSSGAYLGWRVPNIWASGGGPTAVSSDGGNPRGRRSYRGNFEIAPQEFSFEPATHRSALRLVNVLPFDEYLKGVVPWEMNPTAPLEALKAQAICARSETLAKIGTGRHSKDGYDICDYDHCQGYPGTENEKPATNRAVEETSGLVLTHNGTVADAVYFTNSGGMTASSADVWRGNGEAYLQSVRDFSPQMHPATARVVKNKMSEADWVKYCTTNLPSFAQPNQAQIEALAARRRREPFAARLYLENDLPEFYRWTRVMTPAQMAMLLKAPNAVASEVRVLERAPSGRIARLQVVGRDAANNAITATFEKDSKIRAMFSGRLGSTTALPSSTFVVLPRRENGLITSWVLRGAGWGHGAGMCQRGAANHALRGWNARQIVQFYFRGVQIQKNY